MDPEIVILRLLHIVTGAVWVGSAIFLAFVFQPALKIIGPSHAGAIMPNMFKPMLITARASVWLTMIFAMVGYVIGTIPGMTRKRIMDLDKSLQGPTTCEQGAEIARL